MKKVWKILALSAAVTAGASSPASAARHMNYPVSIGSTSFSGSLLQAAENGQDWIGCWENGNVSGGSVVCQAFDASANKYIACVSLNWEHIRNVRSLGPASVLFVSTSSDPRPGYLPECTAISVANTTFVF